ncbi:hypothetical protein ICV35_22555 [Rhodococcus ruber]|uniref:hypothetical protein n=1 Tax=Rhodococcus ruber TaxID=1830 RepID=UPI00177E106B|nr:hypothetical protein [Rhodococcus ruber]MBD8056437.1 hypothetical protein [Rhodococcus ruber]
MLGLFAIAVVVVAAGFIWTRRNRGERAKAVLGVNMQVTGVVLMGTSVAASTVPWPLKLAAVTVTGTLLGLMLWADRRATVGDD